MTNNRSSTERKYTLLGLILAFLVIGDKLLAQETSRSSAQASAEWEAEIKICKALKKEKKLLAQRLDKSKHCKSLDNGKEMSCDFEVDGTQVNVISFFLNPTQPPAQVRQKIIALDKRMEVEILGNKDSPIFLLRWKKPSPNSCNLDWASIRHNEAIIFNMVLSIESDKE